MTQLLQPSFGGGEYAEALWGRADLARYGISGRTFRNYIVRPTGGFESRRGTQYLGTAKLAGTRKVRVLDFVVSTSVSYVVELGHLYARFWANGAPVTSGGAPVEVVTPWTEDELAAVRYTQSADTMFLVHRSHPPQVLRRTGASSFTISAFPFREGPFRSINGDDSLVIAASAKTGTVTVTTNFDLFTPAMVGALIYMEPKALGNIKPWVQGERTPNLAVGVMRMSDGKVYKATNVAIPGSGASPDYCETGNVRPTHETGKAWDGPGDTKLFDTINYRTGVEWEYQHSGYGLVQITGYIDARTATAVVKKTLPPEVVGGVGVPANSWTLSGDGATKAFAIAGASGTSNLSYTVTISGTPYQSDPNYQPPPTGPGTGTNTGVHERLPGTYDP